MIRLVTYSDEKMLVSAKLCGESAEKHGVQGASCVLPEAICSNFTYTNRDIFKEGARGAGCYWLFKPYVINGMMLNSQDNDILIYADAGIEFIDSVHHIINRMDEDVFLFTNTHPNHHWTKRYTLDRMQPNWERMYGKDDPWPQVQASCMFIKVNAHTRDFIKTWLLWCQMPGILDDSKGPCGEYPFFQDHRHDQSVLSILATQAGYKLHWWPTQYAMHIKVPGDDYPVLINHHRLRDPGKGDGQPEW